MRAATCALTLGSLALAASDAAAQQVTVGTPYHSVGDSFFENIGTSWGLRGPNWGLSVFGSPIQAAPQFGGFDPSAGANFGFGFGGASGNFSANMAQGSRRSFTSVTPSVTLHNGFPGSISDTSQSPFVISYIPVVGGFPTIGTLQPIAPRPIHGGRGSAGGNPAAARSSSAARPAMSVAEARRLHEQEQAGQTDEVLGYLQRAQGAEAAGKLNVAKIYYQMAHRRAAGELRGQIQARLRALGSGP